MANALQWIIREAKHLRRKDRNRREWKEYIAQASAIYARKHKGRSPVGKPRKKTKRRRVVGAVRRKPRKRVRGVSTRSKSHVDKNRITANIQVGSTTSQNFQILHELRRENEALSSAERRLHMLRTSIKKEPDKFKKRMMRRSADTLRKWIGVLKKTITQKKALIK